MRPRFLSLVVYFVMALFAFHRAHSQSVYGTVKGNLTDTEGKAIPGAKVTLSSAGKGARFVATTDQFGFYAFNDVKPDDYVLKVEATGFKSFQNPLVTVYADNTSHVNPKLATGNSAEVINGSPSDVSILKIDRTDVSTILSRIQIADLPLQNQNTSLLEVLAAGAIPVKPILSSAQNPQQGTYINVNGQSFSGTAYQLDGTDNRDPLEGIVVVNPNQDSVGEMKITTQNYSAEFGEATAGVVTIQTKSGSNTLHGSLFGYNESGIGEASSPFLSSNLNHITNRQNQFGGTIGGPIITDRLFFFTDYRGNRNALGATVVTTVPSANMLSKCGPTSIPSMCDLTDYGGGSNLTVNPVTRFILGFIPPPHINPPPSTPINNYQKSGTEPLNSDNSDFRFDYDASQHLRAFGRYSYDLFRQDGTAVFGTAGGKGLNPDNFAGHARTYNQSVASGFSYRFNSNLITDARLGYLGYHLDLNAPDFGDYPLQSVLPELNESLFSSDMPEIKVDGYWTLGYSSLLNNCNCPLREREQQFQLVNNWTRLLRKHAFRWGGDFRYIRNFRLDSANPRSGYLEFNSVQDFVNGALAFFDRTYSDPTNVLAFNAGERQKRAFFYGQDTWRITPRLTLNYGLRWELYFPQYVSQAHAGGFLLIHHNTLPSIDAASINEAGTSGVNLQGNVQNTFKNFGPRLGVAYLLNDKTVIRAGYGRSFDVGYSGSIFGIVATQNPPIASLLVARKGFQLPPSATTGCQQYSPFCVTLPSVLPITVSSLCEANNDAANNPHSSNNICSFVSATVPDDPNATNGAPSFQTVLSAVPDKLRLPTVDAWHFTLQHEISRNMYIELAYVGNKGTHVLNDPSPVGGPVLLPTATYYNLNQPTLNGLVQTQRTSNTGYCPMLVVASGTQCLEKEFARTALKPWNQPVDYYGNNASNNYNSLQARFNRRFSAGYSILADYVYSKELDYDNNYFAIDPRVGYGPGNFDRRHNFTMANVWELPFGRGRLALRNISSAADKVVGGWSVEALTVWYGGLPFTPQYSSCSTDLNTVGSNLQPCRANIIGPVAITGKRTGYYTIASNPLVAYNGGTCGLESPDSPLPAPGPPDGPWQRPGCGQIGDAGRNPLRGPQFFQSDVAVMKEISFSEKLSLRLRADAFNAFNKVNLGLPNAVVDAGQGTAGAITSTAAGAFQRQFEFSARVQF